MVQKALGNKCLVDTCKIYKDVYDEWDEENDCMLTKDRLFVEMDGFHWDSTEYATLEEFLQSIIDHAYNVAMGKE